MKKKSVSQIYLVFESCLTYLHLGFKRLAFSATLQIYVTEVHRCSNLVNFFRRENIF